MNKSSTKIVHNSNGTWFFKSTVRCSYDPKIRNTVKSETYPKCSGSELLDYMQSEEIRIANIISEMDEDFIKADMQIEVGTIQHLQELVQNRIQFHREGVQFMNKKLRVTGLEDARYAIGYLNTIFPEPSTIPALKAILPHLIRQRVFEFANKKGIIAAHKLF